MILYKTPFRIPLAGGGTDIDFYYKKRGGFLISAAISEYVYTYIAPRPFDTRSLIQTTDTQFVNNNYEIKNEIVRETLKYFKIKDKLHIGNFSSLPTGAGLGSSSKNGPILLSCSPPSGSTFITSAPKSARSLLQ